MDIWHNIEIHIFSVVMHYLTVDMHTMLPFPYPMFWHKYDAHVAWRYLYMCHIWEFAFSHDLLFWEFWLWSLSFLKYWSHHDSNEECIILAYIKHSQPHITLYLDDFFSNWGGNNERNVESLIITLLSASLDSLSPLSNGSLKRLLWNS